MLQKLKSWLSSCPFLAGGIGVNHTDAAVGSAGLYPLGYEEVEVREDVLGNRIVTCRERFRLYQVTAMDMAEPEGERLMALQNWVREQALTKQTPQFGDVPGQEWIRAEKGTLSSVSRLGTGKFTVQITVVYQKILEGSL